MTYTINSLYEEKMIHSKYATDNSITYIMTDYAAKCIELTIHNIDGEVA